MKRIISICLLTIMVLTSGMTLAASDISDAKYLTTIKVTNTGTALTNEAVVFTLSTEAMIDSGMLAATADDAAMLTGAGGSDLKFMPSANESYPWVTWVNSIGESANLFEYLYSKDVTGGEIVYFPDDGGMAVSDNATLEVSANFTISQKGWVDTDAGADKNLVFKLGAFRTFVSPTVSGNITSQIFGEDVSESKDGLLAGNNAASELTDTDYWIGQSFTVGGADDYIVTAIKFYAHKAAGATGTARLAIIAVDGSGLPTGDVLCSNTIDIATGFAEAAGWISVVPTTKVGLLSGIQYVAYMQPVAMPGNTIFLDSDTTEPPYGGGNYVQTTNGGTNWSNTVGVDNLFDIWGSSIVVEASVSATGISSVDIIVTTTANVTHMWIEIDGHVKNTVALNGTSVPDNDNDWVFVENGSMIYMEYTKIWVK